MPMPFSRDWYDVRIGSLHSSVYSTSEEASLRELPVMTYPSRTIAAPAFDWRSIGKPAAPLFGKALYDVCVFGIGVTWQTGNEVYGVSPTELLRAETGQKKAT